MLILFVTRSTPSLRTAFSSLRFSGPRFSSTDREILRAAGVKIASRDIHGFESTVVFIVPLTHHVFPLFLNLRCHMNRVMPDVSLVVIALDSQAATAASRRGITQVRLHVDEVSTGKTMHIYNTPGFRSVSKHKLVAVRNVLAMGLDVVLMDADLIVCNDFRSGLIKELQFLTPTPHMLIQSNLGLRKKHRRCVMNTGFYYARSGARMVRMFDYLVRESETADGKAIDDQELFLHLVCGRKNKKKHREESEGRCETEEFRPRSRCVWREKVIAQALPIPRFPNGRGDVWRRHSSDSIHKSCVAGHFSVFHANFRKGRMKHMYLMNNGLWLTNEENVSGCDNILNSGMTDRYGEANKSKDN